MDPQTKPFEVPLTKEDKEDARKRLLAGMNRHERRKWAKQEQQRLRTEARRRARP